MNKRGASPVVNILYKLAEVIIPMFFLVSSLLYLRSVGNSELFEQQFFATEVSLALDTVLAVPRNIMLVVNPWERQVSGFYLEIKKGEVLVWLNNSRKVRSLFAEDFSKDFDVKIKGVSVAPVISKVGSKVLVRELRSEDKENLFAFECPRDKVELGKIIVDPGHGRIERAFDRQKEWIGDSGVVGKFGSESELVFGIASSLLGRLQALGLGQGLTRKAAFMDLSLDDRKAIIASGDNVISVHANIDDENFNDVRVFYSVDSQRLGCEVANALGEWYVSHGFDISGVGLIPVNSFFLDESFEVLGVRKGILVEVGNVNVASIRESSGIAGAIALGVERASR
jgi:hypothetical protein